MVKLRHSKANCPRSITTDDEARIWTQRDRDEFWIQSIPRTYIIAFLSLYLCLGHCYCIMFFLLLLLLKAHQHAKSQFKCHFLQDVFLDEPNWKPLIRFLMGWNSTLRDTYWLLSSVVESLYLLSCFIPDVQPLEGRTVIYTIFCYSHGHPAIHTKLQRLGSFMMAGNSCSTNVC